MKGKVAPWGTWDVSQLTGKKFEVRISQHTGEHQRVSKYACVGRAGPGLPPTPGFRGSQRVVSWEGFYNEHQGKAGLRDCSLGLGGVGWLSSFPSPFLPSPLPPSEKVPL